MNMGSLGPSPADIQLHLYNSFLHGSTADVALRVHGTWDAIYNLHRVVLIQSGFFRSLFTAGFIESSSTLPRQNGQEEIFIRFDDPNITRAAFEICISRLYGGGPSLDISPFLVPSALHPLTPAFPLQQPVHTTPPGHHPATPRFLLSLLATSVYLSIPSLASLALSSILSTIGPSTVIKYLNFALGRHIGYLEFEPGEPEAAVGLEKVANLIDDKRSIAASVRSTDSAFAFNDAASHEDSARETHSTAPSAVHEDDYLEPSVHYGGISNKIGEACSCWLARWGVDIFTSEEKASTITKSASASIRKRSNTVPISQAVQTSSKSEKASLLPKIWSRGGLDAKWVRAIISADTFFVRGEHERYAFAVRVVEFRRKEGIIAAEELEWTKLFEQGIYYANMTMEHLMQISQDISPTTSQPFVNISILQAANWRQSVLRSYLTVRPPPSGSSSTDSPTSPCLRGKDLGIVQTTTEILANSHTGAVDQFQIYFPIPTDSSGRIGDNGTSNTSNDIDDGSMDRLFASTSSLLHAPPSSPTLKASSTGGIPLNTSESNFFGLIPPVHDTPTSLIASDPSGKAKWTSFPPYRFAVEFWDLDTERVTREKMRLYSQTIWYAGSLFNVYVQVVKKKSPGQRQGGMQVGVYLHRQSSVEPIPPASAPLSAAVGRIKELEKKGEEGGTPPRLTGPPVPSSSSLSSPSIGSRTGVSSRPSTAPQNRLSPVPPPASLSRLDDASSISSSSRASVIVSVATPSLPATAPTPLPVQPFRDPRPAISAYFSISCASATGSSQTRFVSAPDVFSVSQSWGWKSSSLIEMYEGEDENAKNEKEKAGANPMVSLRATVVLGLV